MLNENVNVMNIENDGRWDRTSTKEKVGVAVRLIRSIASQHNCFLAFSSGKDSCVLEFLSKEAGAKVEMIHNVTTIDPEGTLSFAVKHGCKLNRSELSFLDLVEKKGFPTMFRRFCCKILKEKYIGDYGFFGIRKEESVKRFQCYTEFDDIYYYTKKRFTNRFFPMLYFSDDDIQEIVREHDIEMHPLYYDADGRFCVERRLGCIGCPLQGDRGKKDFLAYPILLKQVLRRGILFHLRQGRTEDDAALNLVYNLWYSNNGFEKFKQTYQGLFDTNPWQQLSEYYFIDKDDVMRGLPKPKF